MQKLVKQNPRRIQRARIYPGRSISGLAPRGYTTISMKERSKDNPDRRAHRALPITSLVVYEPDVARDVTRNLVKQVNVADTSGLEDLPAVVVVVH